MHKIFTPQDLKPAIEELPGSKIEPAKIAASLLKRL